MNCKPGDLAMVVRSVMGNDGRIVQCLRLAGGIACAGYPVWEIDTELLGILGYKDNFIADNQLRPITPPAGTVSDAEVTELFKSDTAPMVTREAA
jgi:hypothetical protein